MKLTHLLNKQIVIVRMATISGDKMAFSTVTTEMFHIQPMVNSKDALGVSGVYGKTFRFYTDGDVEIQEGDRLRDDNNDYYTVKSDGVSRRTFGSFDYLIIICEKTK